MISCLAEFRSAERNKVEIHVIRRLCRPETYLSPRKCGILPQWGKIMRAVEAQPFDKKPLLFVRFYSSQLRSFSSGFFTKAISCSVSVSSMRTE